MTVIRVVKRDGNIEDWDKNKILNSIAKSGMSSEESESIATLVEIWSQRFATDQLIKSTLIRAKVVEILQVLEPTSAESFEKYKKL